MNQKNTHKGQLKESFPEMTPGDTVRVSEKILEGGKRKSQTFEGILISQKHGRGLNATFTLRAIVGGVGVEKTYPLHLPLIEKIQIVKRGKSKRAKLYYLREKPQKEIRRKLKAQRVTEEKVAQEYKKEGAEKKKETEKKEIKENAEKSKETKEEPKKEEKK